MARLVLDLRSGEGININGATIRLVHKSGRSFARLMVEAGDDDVIERVKDPPETDRKQ